MRSKLLSHAFVLGVRHKAAGLNYKSLSFGVPVTPMSLLYKLYAETLVSVPFKVKGGDPAALSSTATLLRLHPPY